MSGDTAPAGSLRRENNSSIHLQDRRVVSRCPVPCKERGSAPLPLGELLGLRPPFDELKSPRITRCCPQQASCFNVLKWHFICIPRSGFATFLQIIQLERSHRSETSSEPMEGLQLAQPATQRSPWAPCSPHRRLSVRHAASSGRQRPQAAAGSQQAAPAAKAAGASERPAVPVTFLVGGDNITVQAQPGQNIWEVCTVGRAEWEAHYCTAAQHAWLPEGGEQPSLPI